MEGRLCFDTETGGEDDGKWEELAAEIHAPPEKEADALGPGFLIQQDANKLCHTPAATDGAGIPETNYRSRLVSLVAATRCSWVPVEAQALRILQPQGAAHPSQSVRDAKLTALCGALSEPVVRAQETAQQEDGCAASLRAPPIPFQNPGPSCLPLWGPWSPQVHAPVLEPGGAPSACPIPPVLKSSTTRSSHHLPCGRHPACRPSPNAADGLRATGPFQNHIPPKTSGILSVAPTFLRLRPLCQGHSPASTSSALQFRTLLASLRPGPPLGAPTRPQHLPARGPTHPWTQKARFRSWIRRCRNPCADLLLPRFLAVPLHPCRQKYRPRRCSGRRLLRGLSGSSAKTRD
uniref:uncharacterized protein LOC123453237 n=1 Tax=Jaculus jaculus TaxID=51337 RepID=UPI001E1B1D73|nr:uncharacterized protein LOC123453237 [Jaculus jaculus]